MNKGASQYNSQAAAGGASQAWKVFIAWGFVGIPLLWGVIETGKNALKLFY